MKAEIVRLGKNYAVKIDGLYLDMVWSEFHVSTTEKPKYPYDSEIDAENAFNRYKKFIGENEEECKEELIKTLC